MVRTLKEQIAADNAVFFNVDEFAESLEVDGVKTTGVWEEAAGAAGDEVPADVDAFGLNLESVVLHLPDGVIPPPVPGQALLISRTGSARTWTVKKARADLGVLRLELEVFVS